MAAVRHAVSLTVNSALRLLTLFWIGRLLLFQRFFACLFEGVVHSCLEPPQFNEAFRVRLVKSRFYVVVGQVLVVERHG